MHRALDLYDDPSADARVICADTSGPLKLQPRARPCLASSRAPARLDATYRRHGGVRHMLATLDLATGKMIYRIREPRPLRDCTNIMYANRICSRSTSILWGGPVRIVRQQVPRRMMQVLGSRNSRDMYARSEFEAGGFREYGGGVVEVGEARGERGDC